MKRISIIVIMISMMLFISNVKASENYKITCKEDIENSVLNNCVITANLKKGDIFKSIEVI